MRYGIVSDVHANIQAWKAVLRDMKKEGVDLILCLGDVIGYGPNPAEVLDSCYKHCDYFLLGNHDAVIGNRLDSSLFNDNARYLIEWTRDQLNDSAADFFGEMPLRMEGEGFLCAHGELAVPGRFGYIYQASDAVESFTTTDTPLMFVGHTHLPAKITLDMNRNAVTDEAAVNGILTPGKRHLINVGSVGDPRDGQITASYVIYDQEKNSIKFRKVPFDIESFKRNLAKAQLPVTPFFIQVYDGSKTETQTIKDMEVMSKNQALEIKTKVQKISNLPSDIKGRQTKVTFSMDTVEQTRQYKAREVERKERQKDDKKKGAAVVVGLLGGLFLVFIIVMLIVKSGSSSDSPANANISTTNVPNDTGSKTQETVSQSAEGDFELNVNNASARGSLIIQNGVTKNWNSNNQSLAWKVSITKPGYFRVYANHTKENGEAAIVLEALDNKLNTSFKASEKTQTLGTILIQSDDTFFISVSSVEDGPVTQLESIKLEYLGDKKPNPYENLKDMSLTDFDSPLYPAGWVTTGNAFNFKPHNEESMFKGWTVTEADGEYFAASINNQFSSFEEALKAKGELISPEFVIKHNFINMLLAGSGDNKTEVILSIDGTDVISENLPKAGNKLFSANLNVQKYTGSKARLKFRDSSSEDYVAVDRITFTNEKISTGEVTFTGKGEFKYDDKWHQSFNEAGKAFLSGDIDGTIAALDKISVNNDFTPQGYIPIKFQGLKTIKGNELKSPGYHIITFKQTQKNVKRDTYIIDGEFTESGSLSQFILQTLPEGNQHVGTGKNGNFVLSQFSVSIVKNNTPTSGRFIVVNTVPAVMQAEVKLTVTTDEGEENLETTKAGWASLGKTKQIKNITVTLPDGVSQYTVFVIGEGNNVTWQETNEKTETVNKHTCKPSFDLNIAKAWSNYSQDSTYSIKKSLLPSVEGWGVNNKTKANNTGFFITRRPVAIEKGDTVKVKMDFQYKDQAYFIKKFTLHAGDAENEIQSIKQELLELKNFRRDIMQSYINHKGKSINFFAQNDVSVDVKVFDANHKAVGVSVGKRKEIFTFEKLCDDELEARSKKIPNGTAAYAIYKKDYEFFKQPEAVISTNLKRLVSAGTKGLPNTYKGGIYGRYVEIWLDNDISGISNIALNVETDQGEKSVDKKWFRGKELYPKIKSDGFLVNFYDLKQNFNIKGIKIKTASGNSKVTNMIIRNSEGKIVWQRDSDRSISQSSKFFILDPDYMRPLTENILSKSSENNQAARGLNDGLWIDSKHHRFETGSGPFPKNVTVNIGKVIKLNALRFAVPDSKQRKLIFSVSTDKDNFTEVARFNHTGDKSIQTIYLGEREAKFVRVTFEDEGNIKFDDKKCVLTELEAYYF